MGNPEEYYNNRTLELLRKIKALSEKGYKGEAHNAELILIKLLKKHKLTITDIESEVPKLHLFTIDGKVEQSLFYQIVKRVNYDLELFFISRKNAKKFSLNGNHTVSCTDAEFIEITQMFEFYKELYKKESDIFYTAFLTANNLLAIPPKSEQKTIADLSPEERKEWERVQDMATKIKRDSPKKRIASAKR